MHTQKPADCLTVSQAAAQLGIGPRVLFRVLRDQGILHTDHPLKNAPRLAYIKQGYFRECPTTYKTGPVEHHCIKTLITQKGLIFIKELLDEMATAGPLPHKKRPGLPRQQSHGATAHNLHSVGP